MRKAAIGIAAVAAMIGTPVLAADMAVKAPPLPAPVYSWTGGYIGANGGYGWGGWNSNSLAAIFPDGGSTTADPDVHGWFGGVTAGYNWQTSPQWVVGIEGDFDWTGERASDGSNASTTGPGPSTGFCDFGGGCSIVTATTSANDWRKLWFATLRGRVGFLIEPTWLLYGTGGIAFADTKFSTSSSTTVSIVRNATGQVGSSTTTGAFLSEYFGSRRLRGRWRSRKVAHPILVREGGIFVSRLWLAYLPERNWVRHQYQADRQHRPRRRGLSFPLAAKDFDARQFFGRLLATGYSGCRLTGA